MWLPWNATIANIIVGSGVRIPLSWIRLLSLFAKNKNQRNQLLRAPSSVGTHSSMGVEESKKWLESSRDKNEGVHRKSGEGGEEPAYDYQ